MLFGEGCGKQLVDGSDQPHEAADLHHLQLQNTICNCSAVMYNCTTRHALQDTNGTSCLSALSRKLSKICRPAEVFQTPSEWFTSLAAEHTSA